MKRLLITAAIFTLASPATAEDISVRVDAFCNANANNYACISARQQVTYCKVSAGGFNAMWETYWRSKPQLGAEMAASLTWRTGLSAGFAVTNDWIDLIAAMTPLKMSKAVPGALDGARVYYYDICSNEVDAYLKNATTRKSTTPIPPDRPYKAH